jgi:predicted nucleic acid-binding protein
MRLERPALFDTGVWTWARDRRFPELAEWFNRTVAAGLVLVCDLVVLELVRLSPNEHRAKEVAQRLSCFQSIPMPEDLWKDAGHLQLSLSGNGDHRRVPATDLLLAVAARLAGVALVHYDRDYQRIAAVTDLEHQWFVADGTLTE